MIPFLFARSAGETEGGGAGACPAAPPSRYLSKRGGLRSLLVRR